MMINDYSRGLETIVDKMNPYTIRFTQKEAGFRNDIVEEVLEVDMSELTYKLTSKLKKDLVVEGNEDVILADTPVKLMMKLHQMYSGTVKFESGNSMILDLNKAQFIYDFAKRYNKKVKDKTLGAPKWSPFLQIMLEILSYHKTLYL